MSLTPAQRAARDGRLTASRVGILMSGDDAALLDLWREMVGDPGYEEPDLSDVWAVQLGACTEQLHLDWLERRLGSPVTRRGEVVLHPEADWACCTLDGYIESQGAPVEVKHVGAWSKPEEIRARYIAQLHWQMLVTGAPKVLFSVIYGAKEPESTVIDFDPLYGHELWQRANAFMECVRNLTPPVAMAPVAVPVAPEKWREVPMTGSNAWASHAADWLQHRAAAKTFGAAEKEIKALVEADVGRAFGYGIECRRDKAGRLSIKEVTA